MELKLWSTCSFGRSYDHISHVLYDIVLARWIWIKQIGSRNTLLQTWIRILPELLQMKAGLWIRIHFLRIRFRQFFWMRIRIQEVKWLRIRIRTQLNKFCKKINLWRVFCSRKIHNSLLLSKKQWSFVQIYFKNWIKRPLLAISLPFYVFIWKIFPWIRIWIRR